MTDLAALRAERDALESAWRDLPAATQQAIVAYLTEEA